MSKNLIVVFTRMYAQKGGHEDEFVTTWDIQQDNGKKYLPYYSGDGGQHCYALIVHGHRREGVEPDGFSVDACDEQILATARESIIEGVGLL